MPVTFRSGGFTSGVSLNSGSISVVTGAVSDPGRIFVLSLAWFDPDGLSPQLSSLNWDAAGTPPFLLASDNSVGTSKNQIWYSLLDASTTGGQQVDLLFTDLATFGMVGATFRDVDLADPFGTAVKQNASSSTPSCTDSSASAQDALWDCLSVIHTGVEATRTATGRTQTKNADPTMTYDAANIFSVTASRVVHPGSGDGVAGYSLSSSKTWRQNMIRLKHKQYGASPILVGA